MTIISLTLPGSIRSKKNHKQPAPIPAGIGSKSIIFRKDVKRGKFYPVRIILVSSKAYKAWEKEVRISAKSQLPTGWKLINYPVEVEVMVYYKGPEPDTSGCLESVGDAMEGVIWSDDKYVRRVMGDKQHDLKNPRTEIIVRKII